MFPDETGGSALITGRVLGIDQKGVGAQAEARVVRATRAGAEGIAIKLTEEAHMFLRIGEGEASPSFIC
jgi:hypothetical protein